MGDTLGNRLTSRFAQLILLVFAVSLCAFAYSAKASAFTGSGDGSSGNPFRITTCAQLQSIENERSAAYVLANDINCNLTTFHPIGVHNAGFGGILDGQNHAITNLTISVTSGAAALFGEIANTAIVKNVSITADITNTAAVTGVVAGRMMDQSQVQNVATHGTIHCASQCGGIAALSEAAQIVIANSYSDVTIYGESFIGGLFGASWGAMAMTISDSYFSGDIISSVGGSIGGIGGVLNATTLTRVHSSGNISATESYVGGLIGWAFYNADISYSYSTATISGGNRVGGLIGKTENAPIVLNNVYYNGQINMVDDTGSVGGILGFNETFDFAIKNAYAAGTIAGGDEVGGLVGSSYFGLNTFIPLENTFSAMHFTGAGGPKGPVASYVNEAGVNNYFDTNLTGFSSDPSNIGALPVTTSNDFKGNHTHAPLDAWPFGAAGWRVNPGAYPTFAPMTAPAIRCEEPTATKTTITAHCALDTSDWGAPTWEARWQKQGDSTWHDITLPSALSAQATVTGLSSGTTYIIEFRFTNDFGVSNWGAVEILTAAEAATVKTASSPAKKTYLATNVDTVQNNPVAAQDTSQAAAAPQPRADNPTTEIAFAQDTTPKATRFPWWILLAIPIIILVCWLWLRRKNKKSD